MCKDIIHKIKRAVLKKWMKEVLLTMVEKVNAKMTQIYIATFIETQGTSIILQRKYD